MCHTTTVVIGIAEHKARLTDLTPMSASNLIAPNGDEATTVAKRRFPARPHVERRTEPAASPWPELPGESPPPPLPESDDPLIAADDEPLIPVRLRWALVICVLYHGGLLLFRSYESTYDAYVHIFLGDHYARGWFSTWDQRWYTGFTTVSYPPGTHMATGALSKLTNDLELAFALLQICALNLLTVGVYRFSRIWVHQEAAANAALLLVGSSAIAETVHVFGQLPTTWALAFLLNSLPYLRNWAFEGRVADLVSGVAVLAACTAGHHVTTLFGSVFFLGPVLAYGLLNETRIPAPDEPLGGDPPLTASTALALGCRRFRRAGPALVRCVVLGFGVLGALVLVVLPYWWWSATDPITQISIPHGSRNNFLVDRNIGLVFFVIPWGMMIFVWPYAMARAILDRKWPIAASIGLLSLLGTGGTTPIPRMILGHAFDVLTLDRFTFWASMQILPLAGLFVDSLEKGTVANWLRSTGGPVLLRGTQIGFVLGLAVMSLFSATLAQYRKFQPQRIDTDPIVAFIEKDQHDRWRFLTLGFGDQVAWLSAQTTATQVDGNYHSVRRLPELTSTSVERLEGAKYRGISGLGSLQQFLEVPEKYNLKYVFSNDQFYDPVLHFTGWQRLGPLENGIVVWERADIPPLPAQLPVREVPPWQRIMWGTVPPAAVIAAIHLLVWNLLGRPGLDAGKFDRLRANQRMLFGPFGWFSRFLFKRQAGLPLGDGSDPDDKTPLAHRLLAVARQRFSRPPSRRRQVVRLIVLVVVLGYFPVQATASALAPPSPVEAVEEYYDHLDFRRWELAYDALDPVTKPDYELWRLQVSVRGGMLASYAKLDSLDVEVIEQIDEKRVRVRASLQYLTALNWYPIERVHLLHLRNGKWFIEPDDTEVSVPPDQLSRRADIDYVIQGRRRVTSGTTELTDVQDRPELFIKTADVVAVDGEPVIVGEIVNLDVDPGDITITGLLRNEEEEALGRYNATEHIIHAIRPRESTPFLIRFEEVAAGQNLDFDPFAFEPLKLTDGVETVEVYAKGVVTTGGLYRGLGVNQAEVVENPDGSHQLVGELRNDGVQEAVIPRLLISFLDENGRVMWVQNYYMEYSVRSQRTGSFSVELEDISDHELIDLDVVEFHNGIAPPGGEDIARLDPLIPAPPGASYASIRIDTSTFLGELEVSRR